MEQYTLVILCGGRSMRMGTDKALLPFGNCCLLEYMVNRFSPYFSKIYLSVRKKGDYAHLKLEVVEIPDVYTNAGPLSGIFSTLSMIDEDAAFFISVNTPFMEPELGRYLLEQLDDHDICAVTRADERMETLFSVFSKNCISTIGICLFLKQYSLMNLQQKLNTRYVTEDELSSCLNVPLYIQLFDMATRDGYYQALTTLYSYHKEAFGEDFIIHKRPVFNSAHIPTISFVSHPVLDAEDYINRLIPVLEKDGLLVAFLNKEYPEENLEELLTEIKNVDLILINGFDTPSFPKIEILKKGCLEEPENDDLLALISDFSYKGKHSSFDYGRPRTILPFLREFVLKNAF